MAGRLAKNVTNDYLTCSICFGRFKEPRTLPCEHTFCLACLASHIEQSHSGGKFICPVDRQEVEIQEGCPDVWACAASFKTDPVLLELVGVVDRTSHRRGRRNSDALEFYCFGCKKLVTAEAAVEGHKSNTCECVKLKKAYRKALPELYTLGKELETLVVESAKIRKEQQNTKGLSESQQEVLQQIEQFETKMENFYMQCKEQIGILKAQVLDYTVDEEPMDIFDEEVHEEIENEYTEFNTALEDEEYSNVMTSYSEMRPKIERLRKRLNSTSGKSVRTCSFEFVPNMKVLEMLHKKCSFGTLHSIEHSNFIAQQPNDNQECNFYDVAVTGQYIIASDGLNNVIKRFLSDGTFIDSIPMSNPCRIAIIGEGEIAITRFYKKKITIVTLGRKMHVRDQIRTKKPYVGICHLGNDKFAVSYYGGDEPSGVDIINKDGKIYHMYLGHLNSFENAPLFSIPMFLSTTAKGNIVLCDYSDSYNVVCFDEDLTVLWYKKMTSMPCGITCDNDHIYVTLPDENKMVALYQNDGEKLRNIIKPSDGVRRPYAVSVSNRQIVVSEDESVRLHIFCL